ncbi:anti-sigma factor [Streptomyces sp. NPDC054940]
MNTADPHDLAGAYAADALTREEREAFRRHIDDCPDCAHETTRQQEAAAWLALAAARTPPPRLKECVLAEVARTPQFPATLPGRADRRRGRRGPPLLHLALAASVAAAAALGGLAAWQHQEAREARQEAKSHSADLAQLLTAPDTTFVKKQVDYGGSGTLAVSRQLNQAVYFCEDLASLPSGKTYQLWWADPGDQVRSAGLLPAKAGRQAVALPPPDTADALAITVEPSAGSVRPTTDPLATWPLPTS